MRKNDFSNSATGRLHKLSLDDLETMQTASIESLKALCGALLKDVTTPVILWGCGIVKVSTTYTLSAGAIFYNSEIYPVDAQVLTTGSTVNWVTFVEPFAKDPVQYSDGTSYNVHVINKIKLAITSGIAQWDQIRKAEWVQFDKLHPLGFSVMMAIDASADFDGTGLGKSYTRWENWALMNGANGTINMEGFFPVGQKASDGDYDALGDTGGAKDVALTKANIPPHKHQYTKIDTAAPVSYNGGGSSTVTPSTQDTEDGSNDGVGAGGVGGAGSAFDKRPPFKALRFIQKVA
jgi:hypothetical protein